MFDVMKKLVQALEDKTSHDLVVETFGAPNGGEGINSSRDEYLLGQEGSMLGTYSERKKERKTVLARKQSALGSTPQ